MPDVEANREGTSAYFFDNPSQTIYRIGTGLGNSVRGDVQARVTGIDIKVPDLGIYERTSIAAVGEDDVFILSHSGEHQCMVKLHAKTLVRKVCCCDFHSYFHL